MRWFARLFGFVALALAAIGAVFVIGMRRKSPVVLDAVRRRSRAMKPYILKTAGTKGNAISVVRHVGRNSGRSYETPVTAAPIADGFVVALPYGTNTDWLQNVLEAGSAELVNDGTTYRVDRPEVVPLNEITKEFSPNDQRAHRWFAVEDGLRVHRAEVLSSSEPVHTS
jgi:deazaflavin-dependent oxidoreductase (nitroreductase family)